ncbi:hypothetical protein FOL46_003898, partial [Perkinsus olseni]
MRIFINNADTYVGNALCADLQKILETPTRIYATVKGGDDCQVPPPVRRIVSRRDQSNVLKAVSQSHLAVFDLHSSDLAEVDFILRRLKSQPLDQQLVLVLISSVMVWARTKPNSVDESVGDGLVPETASENASDAEELQSSETAVLTDADWRRRVPSSRYRSWKKLETLALSLNSLDSINAYVVCSGVLYGNGELTFYDDFRAAWLGEVTHRIIGDGENIIPTLHVRDLARCVRHLSAATEEQSYVIAVDDGLNKQKEILTAIVNHLGTGVEVPKISYDQAVACLDEREAFLLDVRLQASDFLHHPEFTWWSKDGPVAAVDKLINEFCAWRNLRPLKLVLIGPPASGKTFYAAKIAESYRLVHITVGPVVQEALARGKKVKAMVDPEAQESDAEPVDVESLDDRDRQEDFRDGPFYLSLLEQWEELEGTQPNPRLPAPMICKAIRYELERRNACKFRGYVLDGFPRTAEEARELFVMPLTGKEGVDDENEDGDETSKKLVVDDTLRPGWAFLLQSELDACRSRLEALTEAEATGTHNTVEDFQRRADGWTKEIESHGSVTVLDALNNVLEGERTCREIKVDGVDTDDVVDIISQAIEHEGCPYNYIPSKRTEVEAKTIEMEREELRKKQAEV